MWHFIISFLRILRQHWHIHDTIYGIDLCRKKLPTNQWWWFNTQCTKIENEAKNKRRKVPKCLKYSWFDLSGNNFATRKWNIPRSPVAFTEVKLCCLFMNSNGVMLPISQVHFAKLKCIFLSNRTWDCSGNTTYINDISAKLSVSIRKPLSTVAVWYLT